MTSVLHSLVVNFHCLQWKTHCGRGNFRRRNTRLASSWTAGQPARPEDFLNESRVTFQQTKTSTQPDNPVNSTPCVCMCVWTHMQLVSDTHKHTYLAVATNTHYILRSASFFFYSAPEKTTRTHCLDQSASPLSSTTPNHCH